MRPYSLPRYRLMLVKESGADLLIIAAHGHKGIKDWFYGETIESVRHQLKTPKGFPLLKIDFLNHILGARWVF